MEPSTSEKLARSTGPIFKDDPNAIAKLEKKLEALESEKAYWKTVKKTVPRDYSQTPGDAKWYMPQNVNANIRSVKKKIEEIKVMKKADVKLVRVPVYLNGKKHFKYVEVPRLE